jgi:hypothetical protein
VLHSGAPFSPIAYPWGWPLVLAPFVFWWGLDYDRLKLLEVAAFCAWMLLVHGIVRRRAGRGPAIAVVAVVASTPILLAHTDELLSEYPQAVAVAVFVWWLDRTRCRHDWTAASTGELLGLGALGAVAFHFRRESLVLVGVIAAAQLVDAVPAWRTGRRVTWRVLATPYVGFAAVAFAPQLVLPSTVIPDDNGGAGYLLSRLGDYTGVLPEQLGFGRHPVVGVTIWVLVAVGVVVGSARRPALDVPLATLMILFALAVSTHFRMVGRYYFQLVPWVVYFALVAVMAITRAVASWAPDVARTPRGRRAVTAVALVPLLVVCLSHAVVLQEDIAEARAFDGKTQVGPAHPLFEPVFAVVRLVTPPDAVVAFMRARTMTLLTGRRSLQTMSLDDVIRSADWFAQLKGTTFSQPSPTATEARASGLVLVWQDANWILWRVARRAGETLPVASG